MPGSDAAQRGDAKSMRMFTAADTYADVYIKSAAS